MHTFTDAAGRTWELELTLGFVRRMPARYGVCLLTSDEAQYRRLAGLDEFEVDLVRDVVWGLIAPQAEQQQVEREAWEDAFTTAAETAMTVALWREIGDFFQSRPTCRNAWSAVIETTLGRATEIPSATTGTGSTSSPESSGATGETAPSAN